MNFASRVESALQQQDFDTALALYVDWYQHNSDKADSTPVDDWHPQHRANAANLARKYFYLRVFDCRSASSRMAKAIDQFIGLQQRQYSVPLQQPSFFYLPDLPAQPFYQVDEIEGLNGFVAALTKSFQHTNYEQGASESYLKRFENVPATQEWQKLNQDWQSILFMVGGKAQESLATMSDEFKRILQHDVIADCPPFAPEVFVSTLEPGAYIPPHFGLSNIKLTLHIPLRVNSQSSLTAGDHTFVWQQGIPAMIFDDSFEHSARNQGDTPRTVLILDIWHPQLSNEEKQALRVFFSEHETWKQGCGILAAIDAGR